MNSKELATRLKPKQVKFANLYADGTRTLSEAYQDAGYKTDNMKPETLKRAAIRCMSNVHLKAYYDALVKESAELAVQQITYSKRQWMENQLATLEMAMGIRETLLACTYLGETKTTSTKVVNLSAAIRAQEQLGKVLGLFVNKLDATENIRVNNLIAEISKEASSCPEDSPLPKDNVKVI